MPSNPDIVLSLLENVDSNILLDLSTGTDEAKERLVYQAIQLEQGRSMVNKKIVMACAALHDRLDQSQVPRRLTAFESMAFHRILDGLTLVARDFHHDGVNPGTFENLSALSSQAGYPVFDDWLRNGISYCMHGADLSSRIAKAHAKTCDAIEKFDVRAASASGDMPSASLGLFAKIERFPATEDVKTGVKPT